MDLARCLPIRLLILDVDGVLTDGRIVMDDHGLESKFFHVRDGFGIKLMQRVGLKAALITGRQSRIVEVRAKDLGIEIVHQGIEDKYRCYEDLIAQLGLAHEQTAFAGDDLLDLPVMRRVGLALAPADAVPEVRAAAHYVSRATGGRGAVREMIEVILKAQGLWDRVLARFDPGPEI